MSIEEQTPSAEPAVPGAGEGQPPEEAPKHTYTREQKLALTAGMCQSISEDLGVFAKALVEHDNGDGYLMSYETVAILSAKILRGKAGLSSLARVLEGGLPKDTTIADLVASTKTTVKGGTDDILSSLQVAVLNNKIPLAAAPVADAS